MLVGLEGDVLAQKRILGGVNQEVAFLNLYANTLRLKNLEILLQSLVKFLQTRRIDLPGAWKRLQKPKKKANEYDHPATHLSSGSTTPSGMNCDRSPW